MIAMERWNYSDDYHQTFTNESNFSINLSISGWYAVKQTNFNHSTDQSSWKCLQERFFNYRPIFISKSQLVFVLGM